MITDLSLVTENTNSFLKAAFEASNGLQDAVRKDAFDQFLKQGIPTTKHEEWKYTSVLGVTAANREIAGLGGKPSKQVSQSDKNQLSLEFAARIFVVDGRVAEIENRHPEVITILEERQSERFGVRQAAESAFVALNTAFAPEMLTIRVAKNQQLDAPILIQYLGGDATDTFAHVKLQVHAERGSGFSVVEYWADSQGNNLINHVVELSVQSGAVLRHYKVQNQPSLQLIDFTQAYQEADSQYHAMTLTGKCKFVRNNLHATHNGSNCETHMNGIYLTQGSSHVDNHTLVDHAHPNSFSNELYKGVLAGESTAVFNGKVMVRLDAQKTNAFQSNRTVLLSKGARMNTKPQLEIFADDVKCSHGATTGRLDDEALFYLRSRGLSKEAATALLTFAFAAEVLERLPNDAIRTWLHGLVSERLENLTRV